MIDYIKSIFTGIRDAGANITLVVILGLVSPIVMYLFPFSLVVSIIWALYCATQTWLYYRKSVLQTIASLILNFPFFLGSIYVALCLENKDNSYF